MRLLALSILTTLLSAPLTLTLSLPHNPSPPATISDPSPQATILDTLLPVLETRTAGWTIRNFTRNCSDPKSCVYDLGIDNGVDVKPIPCAVTDRSEPVATIHSFYDMPCPLVPAYHLSWGYNTEHDFAVVTIVHVPSQEEAFFGYDFPNANNEEGKGVAVFKDVGPRWPQRIQ